MGFSEERGDLKSLQTFATLRIHFSRIIPALNSPKLQME